MAFRVLMVGDVGLQVRLPLKGTLLLRVRCQSLRAVPGSSSDTQLPSCLLNGRQLLAFSVPSEVTHGWPIMTNLLLGRGRSSMDALA
jgi:hypothetical protein